jgi:hypothetical protein
MPAMARHVTFRSSRFETRTPAPHFINPHNFGEDVAGWLRSKLPAGLEPGEVIQEDYGWGTWTRSGDDPVCLAVDAALQGDSSITDIRWWDVQPFIGSGKAHPTDGGA